MRLCIFLLTFSLGYSQVLSQDIDFIGEQVKNLKGINKSKWQNMPDSFHVAFEKYETITSDVGNIRGDVLIVKLDQDSVQLFDEKLDTQYSTVLSTREYLILLKGLHTLAKENHQAKIIVKFQTQKDGAVVKYISPFAKAANQKPSEANGLTNNCSASIQQCQYYVWIERNGVKCSDEKLIQVDENTERMSPIFIVEKFPK